MQRKRALVVAGAVSATLVGASTAMAISGGLLDARANDGAGTLSPVVTVVDPTGTIPPAPAVESPDSLPVATSGASEVTANGGDDDHFEGERAHEGGHEYEFEGADDDD